MCSKLKQSTKIINDLSEGKINNEQYWFQQIIKAEQDLSLRMQSIK